MKYILIPGFAFFFYSLNAQLTCQVISQPGTKYKQTDHKNGRGRLFHTDSAITNRMQYKVFELKMAGDISAEEKAELAKYKIKFEPTDTIMFYDWDIMHHGKMGYHGKAVAKVRFNYTDSTMSTYKYLLSSDPGNYTNNKFKIFRMNEKDFII